MTVHRALFAALLLAPLPALAAPPSFDCGKATTPVERTICGSSTLSALDVAIATAYGRAMKALPAERRDLLKSEQRRFLAVRDDGFAADPTSLEERLRGQARFLESLDPSPSHGIAGVWGDTLGRIEIGLASENRATVRATSAEPIDGRWVCEIEGAATAGAGGWRLAVDEGWTVTLTEAGGLLRVTTTPPKGWDGPTAPPFCGSNGTIDGDYLPLLQ